MLKNVLNINRFGLVNKLNVSIYAKPEFDWEQMEQIRLGLEDNIDVSIYAKPELDWSEMEYKRISF